MRNSQTPSLKPLLRSPKAAIYLPLCMLLSYSIYMCISKLTYDVIKEDPSAGLGVESLRLGFQDWPCLEFVPGLQRCQLENPCRVVQDQGSCFYFELLYGVLFEEDPPSAPQRVWA